MAQPGHSKSSSAGSLPLNSDYDVVTCRQVVKTLASGIGFSATGLTMLVTAASELARNTVIHGGGGTFSWEVIHVDGKDGVRLTFQDAGPGIPDVERAMTNGWTSGGGMGLGLPGAKRLSDEFDLRSTPGVGTRIVITRWSGHSRRKTGLSRADWNS